MATTIWDPANLLQISYEAHIPSAPIFCVGESKNEQDSPRCRYTILEPDSSRIRTSLTNLASKDPQSVEREALHTLAFLCLCDRYHKDQAKEVTDRWVRIVKQAAAQSERLARPRTSSSASSATWWDSSVEFFPEHVSESGSKREEALAATAAELKESKEMANREIESLRGELDSLHALLEEAKKNELESTAGAYSMKSERDKLMEEMDKLRSELLEANESGHRLHTDSSQVEGEKRALSEELDTLRRELVVATDRVQHLEIECSRVNEEMGVVRTDAADLSKKNSVILHAVKKMEAERDAARDSHQKVLIELAEQKRSYIALQNELQSLELVKPSPQQGIETCWYRRLLAWVSQFRMHAVLLLSLCIVELGRARAR